MDDLCATGMLMARRKATGDSGLEALRVLKRRRSDVIYAAMKADLAAKHRQAPAAANESAATAA